AGQKTASSLFRGVTTGPMIGRTFALMTSSMQLVHRTLGRWRSRRRARYALALAGGGVIGGMYEVGAPAALEERLNGSGRAFDINTAERVVFGAGALRDVPISQAVAASSAIPGFFDPYPINGRDYVDGGTGFSGHADLAAEAGADVVFVVNPLVPNIHGGD